MTAKSKVSLVVAVALILAAAPITLESWQLAQTNSENGELARQTSALQTEMAALNAQLHKAGDGRPQGNALAVTPPDGDQYIPVNLEVIKNLSFPIVGQNFQMSETTAGLLGLTPEETDRVQAILTEMQARIQVRERGTVQEVAPEDVKEAMVTNFLQRNPGTQSVYELPPMSDDELAAFQQWFTDGITNAIGPERGGILVSSAINDHFTQKLWLSPGSHATVAFSDYLDADGTPKTAFASYYMTAHGGGGGGNSGSKDAIPPEWAFLFQNVDGSPQPPAPAPSILQFKQ